MDKIGITTPLNPNCPENKTIPDGSKQNPKMKKFFEFHFCCNLCFFCSFLLFWCFFTAIGEEI